MDSRVYGLTLMTAALTIAGPVRLVGQDEPTRSFVGDIGFVNASGNTSVTTLNVGDKLVIRTPDKRVVFTQTLGLLYGRTDGEKSAENYRARLRLDYGLSPAVFLFGLVGWDRNVFGGISRRFEQTAGVAWKAVQLPQDKLEVEAGLSLFEQRNTVAVGGSFNDMYAAGRAAAEYRHDFTSSTFVTQGVEFIPNFDVGQDWRLNSETAFVAPISTHLGLKLGYVIRYDDLPSLKPAPAQAGERFRKTDRFFTAGLTISY